MIKKGDIIFSDDGTSKRYAIVDEVFDTYCKVFFIDNIFIVNISKGTVPLLAIKKVWRKQDNE